MLSEYFIPFDRGGSEWSVYFLARGLIANNIDVTIFTPNYGAQEAQRISEIDIYRFPFYKRLKKNHESVTPFYHTNIIWFLVVLIELFKFCRLYKPSVIHIQGKYFLPAAVIVGKILKIPTILTIRDYIILCPYAYCINNHNHYKACSFMEAIVKDRGVSFNKSGNLSLVRYILTFFSAIYGWIVSMMLQFFSRRVTTRIAISHKLKEIYENNNIAVESVIFNSMELKRLKKPQKGKYFLYVGRLTDGKGVDLLIDTYKDLFKKNKLRLVFIGTGPLKNKIPEGIEVLGHRSYSSVRSYMKKAIAVIVPSQWEEPFGRVALEALALGIPVVASNRGGLPEIVNNNKTGIICEPNSKSIGTAMEQMKLHEMTFKKRILNSQKKLKNTFHNNPLTQYIKIYKTLV